MYNCQDLGDDNLKSFALEITILNMGADTIFKAIADFGDGLLFFDVLFWTDKAQMPFLIFLNFNYKYNFLLFCFIFYFNRVKKTCN